MVSKNVNPDIVSKTLPNGLMIHHIKSQCKKLFRIELIIRGGGLDEKPEELGFAHFIEHLMSFYPSRKWPDSVQNQQELHYRSIAINAWTEPNTVGYYMDGASRYRDLMIDLMMENYVDPLVDEEVFEQERNAVVSELNSIIITGDYDMEQAMEYVKHRNNNVSYTVRHEQNNVQHNATLDNIMTFRERLYKPEYTTIILCSSLDHDNAEKLLSNIQKKWFSNITSKSTPKNLTHFGNSKIRNDIRITIASLRPTIRKVPELFNDPEGDPEDTEGDPEGDDEEVPLAEVVDTSLESILNVPTSGIFYIPSEFEDNVCLQIHFPLEFTLFDDARFCAQYLNLILTHGIGSRLFYSLRTKLGGIYSVMGAPTLDPRCINGSYFVIETQTSLDKAKDVIDYILLELSNLIAPGVDIVTDDEMKQYNAMLEVEYNTDICSRSPKKMLNHYKQYLIWGKRPETFKEIHEKMKKITPSDLKKFAMKYIDPNKMQIFYAASQPALLSENNKDCHFIIPIEAVEDYSKYKDANAK